MRRHCCRSSACGAPEEDNELVLRRVSQNVIPPMYNTGGADIFTFTEHGVAMLASVLNNTNLYGQSKKISRPHYWVVLSTVNAKGKNRIVLLEVNNTKENVEIVHWHYIRNDALKTLKRQAGREGGHILVLPSEKRKRPVAFPAVRSIRLFLAKILKNLQKQVVLSKKHGKE